jgi:type II secretory pathway pseudopilin PulG
LFVWFHSRVQGREDGFALIEVVVAILVIFAAMSGLIYTATQGFRYDGYARERQTATGVAQSRIEQIRGIAYTDVAGGLKTSDVGGDTNIVNCSGTYRFKSCTAGANGVGDAIINSTGASNATLVPHTGTITSNNITFTWAEYVTNPSPSTSPYTVTVIVTWGSAFLANYANNLVQVQSLFFAPTGSSSVCQSSSTHPYPAPCSAFFYGQALVPRGSITISGTVSGLTFQNASLLTGGAESDGQVEQVGEVQGNFTRSGVTMSLSDGTRTTAGGTSSTTTAADTDPSGAIAPYQNVGPTTVAGGTIFSGTGCTGSPAFCVTAPSDSAQSQSAAAAGGSSACPPSSVAGSEADGQPCGGSTVQQGGNLTATATLSGISGLPNLGTITLVQIATASALPQTSFANRQLVSGQDGYQQQTVQRRFGTINIGGLPSSPFTHPVGFDNQCNGYLLTLSNYRDSSSATAGTSAAAPTATVSTSSPSPLVSYWNGSSCTQNVAATSNVPAIPNAIFSQTYSSPNRTVTITMTTTGLSAPIATMSSTPSGSGSITRTAASAQLTSPIKGTVTYVVTVTQANTTTVANLTIQIDLGTTLASGTYQPAPSAS